MSDSTAPLEPVANLQRSIRRRRWRRRVLLLLGPVVVALGAGYVYLSGGRYVGTEDAYLRSHKIQVSADISARVVDVLVHENEPVKAGQTLFRLDPEPLQIAIEQAKADLDQARNDIAALKASYRQRQEDLRGAQANLNLATSEFHRRDALVKSGAISQSEYEKAHNEYNVAQQDVAGIQQDISRILSKLAGNPTIDPDQHPSVRAAQAKVDQAELDLRHATVAAPSDGVVTQVDNLRVGNYLRAGTPAFMLMTTQDVWVEANMKETDLTFVQPGQTATVEIDTYPGRDFTATVDSIGAGTGAEFSALPAQNATGNWVKVVQRIPVRLVIHPSADQPALRAGMSAVIEIDTHHKRELPGIVKSAMAWVGQAPADAK
jgi:membrane fusion protein (multidrug efflux system)